MGSRTNMVKMGEHIADLRKKKKYTQKILGDILDVSDKTISKWEKGVVAPDITILQPLANALDVSVEEILIGEEVNNINTIEALDIYSNMTKNKLIKTFIIFLSLFLIIVLFIFRIEDYYSWHLNQLYSKGDISLKGYLLINNKESKIVINELYLANKDINYNIKSINLIVKDNNDVIYNEKSSYDYPMDISVFLNNYVISIEAKKKINKKDISVYFVFEEENGMKKTYTYDFE